jgi:LysR family hydrogen peroxide-inducible transcriptional activator
MNIKELTYLIAVIETGNFTDAADICCVTQPTLSAGIKRLEDELDVQLITRGTKYTGGIRATPAGLKILSLAKGIQSEAEKIKKIAKNSKNPLIGDLRIGAFPTLCPYLMHKILPIFKRELPQMRFFIHEERSETLINMLDQEKLDIAFLALPFGTLSADNNTDSLIKVPLFFDPFFLAIPLHHPLANEKSISTDDILPSELLLLEEGHCLRTQALAFCQFQDTPSHKENTGQIDFRGSSLETLLSMVRMGTGYTFVPHIALSAYRPDVVVIPLKDTTIGRQIYTVYNNKILQKTLIDKCTEFLDVGVLYL